MNIHVVMTAFNRVDLLTKCVDSIVESDYYPVGKICVFDDCSDDERVQEQINRIGGVEYEKNPIRIGCDGNTPHALEVTFTKNPDCTHILILDSDLAVTKEWWAHIERCVKSMESDEQIGAIQALNLDNIPSKSISTKYLDMLECIYLSGCGLIVSRIFWQTFVVKQSNYKWFAWDVRSTEAAHRCGFKNYCLKETAMQHLGAWDGSHRGPGQIASTFIGTPDKPGDPFRGTTVCLIAGENFCDIALAIMAARIAKKRGFATTIINQNKEWGEFISIISNKEIKVNDYRYTPESRDGRYNLITKDVQKMLGGVSVVINMETAADECRWMIYSCSGDVEKFIEAKLVGAGISCTKEDFDWELLRREDKIDALTYRGYSIGNHTIVNDLDNDKDKIKDEVVKIEGIVKLLVHERPNDGSWRNCIYKLSPWMTVKAINSAGRFVSVMNKSAFVSLFCRCEKQIYDKDDFAQIILPKTERIQIAGGRLEKVILWAPFELTEEMKRHFKGYKISVSADEPACAEGERLIPIDPATTGFYPGWAEDILANRNRLTLRRTK
jgi:hypothetical protein